MLLRSFEDNEADAVRCENVDDTMITCKHYEVPTNPLVMQACNLGHPRERQATMGENLKLTVQKRVKEKLKMQATALIIGKTSKIDAWKITS